MHHANADGDLIHEVHLEVEDLDDDHVEKLSKLLSRPVTADDELTCEALYEVNGADPSVGIMYAQVDVYAVTYVDDTHADLGEKAPRFDVTDFFNLNKIATQIEENAE